MAELRETVINVRFSASDGFPLATIPVGEVWEILEVEPANEFGAWKVRIRVTPAKEKGRR